MKRRNESFWFWIWERLQLLLVLVAVGAATLAAMQPPAEQEHHVYVLQQDDTLQATDQTCPLTFETDGLSIQPGYQNEPQAVLTAGQEITIQTDDGTQTAVSRWETVANLLHRLNITVNDDDMVIFDLDQKTPNITIKDEIRKQRDVTVETGYQTERRANPMLYQGTEQVVQQGVPGTIIETYEDVYRMGRLADTQLVAKTDDTAVTEIIEYGTRVGSVDRSDRISSVHSDDGSSGGYLTFNSGATMAYSKVLTCNATAYSTHGSTATGYPTAVGNIAVDPSVIPYGTRMYIQTTSGSWVYGMAVARDCGGAIQGNRLDLWFDSYSTACSFGRRDCTVYILL
jgi:3D (Asp-Asp-Asp) domain-containing protein